VDGNCTGKGSSNTVTNLLASYKKQAWPKTIKELWLLVQVFGLLTALRLLLPHVQIQTLLRWLALSRIPPVADPDRLETVRRYTEALLWRIPFPSPGKCLPRSLTLYYFAARYGFPVQVHCGVRRMGERLQGHAWLSLYGRPFLEEDNPGHSYAVIFSFPSPERAGAVAGPPAINS